MYVCLLTLIMASRIFDDIGSSCLECIQVSHSDACKHEIYYLYCISWLRMYLFLVQWLWLLVMSRIS